MPHAAITSETPKSEITIQGLAFAILTPYAAGDTLNEAEASVINQTRLENIRNNFAGRIKKFVAEKVAEAEKAGNPIKAEDVEVDPTQFTTDLEAFDASYEFGVRRVGSGPALSPLEKEARKIAREKITVALKEKGHKIADLPEGWMDAKVAEVAQAEAVQKEAQRRINSIGKIAIDELGDLGTEAPAAA